VNAEQSWPFRSWDELVVFTTLGLAERHSISELVGRLDMDIVDVKIILDRLIEQDLVERYDMEYSLKVKQVADEIPAITCQVKKTIQKKFLSEAINKIDEVDIEKRLNGTLTFPMDMKVLPKVKQRIARFMAELNGLCAAESAQVSEVYNLTLALYPLRKEAIS
jgi:uncharacterized protein (TIGR02147 family)